MKWSFPLFRAFGIPVRLHITFFLLVGLVVMTSGDPQTGEPSAEVLVAQLALLVALYTIVTLHEFGHAFFVRRYGGEVIDIVLWPLGGMARMRRLPEKPKQEIVIALAGPAVNFVLFLLLLPIAGPTEVFATIGQFFPTSPDQALDVRTFATVDGAVRILAAVNLMIGVFNLIPAFPMDGGRVLRGLLGLFTSFTNATRMAVTVSRMVAGLMIGFGVLSLASGGGGIMFMLIGAFILFAGASEVRAVQQRTLLAGVRAADAMYTSPRLVSPQDPLSALVDLALHGNQDAYPVVWDGRLVGWLTRDRILQSAVAPAHGEPMARELMDTQFAWVRPEDSVEAIVPRLEATGATTVPVVTPAGRLLGLLGIPQIIALTRFRQMREVAGRTG